MENSYHVDENCKVFIDQYISCKNKELDKSRKMNTKFTLKDCIVLYDLARICVNSHINFTKE